MWGRCLDRPLGADPVTARKVLVITTDPLTARMPGPAIRAWNLAQVLAEDDHEVTLVSAVACDRRHPSLDVRLSDGDEVERLAASAEVIVGPGSVARRYPGIARSDTPLVVDIYDPYQLENLEPDGQADLAGQAANITHLNTVVGEDLRRGDFFLCASARQRDFWLGSLAALGRVNPYTYADDPGLHRLVDVVPFGLPSAPPVRHGPGLRDRIEGIGPTDQVVVWGGGVYNWFDPASLVRAVALACHRMPGLRLVFLGMRNPNPHIPEMRVATEVRDLAGELGLAGTHVFFNEGWVPYDDRADFLLDADLGVSTHLDHIETRFSFRTRVLDYLWAGLPMLLTEGDALAEVVAAADAGLTVPAGDVEAIADALVRLLDDPFPRQAVHRLAGQFHWSDVAGPLVDFCRQPRPAPDRSVGSSGGPGLLRSRPSMAEALVTPPPLGPEASTARRSAGPQLSPADVGYLSEIRGALRRLGRRDETEGDPVHAALVDLGDAADIDIDVPTASRRQEAAVLKQGIKKLTGWYLRYLAQQTTVLGQATLRLGTALAYRAERVEDTTTGLLDEVARLRERVERLERAGTANQHSQTDDRQTDDKQTRDPLTQEHQTQDQQTHDQRGER
jgi:glycosyltransferase involved in cell wall biosynthesis